VVIKNNLSATGAIKYLLILIIAATCSIAKSNPTYRYNRFILFKRAKSLDNGINISGLEQTWNQNILHADVINDSDFVLLNKLGFKSIRLPVAFTYFQSKHIPDEVVLKHVDKILKQCKAYGFKLIIDNHYGSLNDTDYLTETPKLISLWRSLAKRYIKESPDELFFELYNEPPHMNPQIWKDAAYNIVTAIRQIDQQRTLIVGASNYNSIYELSRFVRFADDNIIYTFHFYEPFLFTHQGASWVGNPAATTGVPFPYNEENFPAIDPKTKNTWGETNYNQYPRDGNEQSIKDKLQIVKNWSAKYDVPILCGEYGAYNKYADPDSRCRYIKAVHTALKALDIPGILWEYNSNFSIFNGKPSINNLPACMRDAIGYAP
jgi:endoglucanase